MSPFRLASVSLDDSARVALAREIDHERAVAISDLLHVSHFAPEGHAGGPYALVLSIREERLVLDIATADSQEKVAVHVLSLTPFRRIVRDYFMICESYYSAIRTSTVAQIEAIDMGRRGLHNEGAEILRQRLEGKIGLDEETARRLFTLICVLHFREHR